MSRQRFNTIIDAISDRQERGYSMDFSMIGGEFFCVQQQRYMAAEEFEVRELYRFRDGTSSHAEKKVFAIESNLLGWKGILLGVSLPVLKRQGQKEIELKRCLCLQ